jgi:hypothetical protein
VIAPTKSIQAILCAVHFAAEKHANQRRKGIAAEPYINHLVEVAELVSNALEEPDTNLVIAALLHDTIEDAGVTREELAERFGPEVAKLVAEVTDDKLLPKHERKRLQIENAPTKSIGAQTIQLADKISNLQVTESSSSKSSVEKRSRPPLFGASERNCAEECVKCVNCPIHSDKHKAIRKVRWRTSSINSDQFVKMEWHRYVCVSAKRKYVNRSAMEKQYVESNYC